MRHEKYTQQSALHRGGMLLWWGPNGRTHKWDQKDTATKKWLLGMGMGNYMLGEMPLPNVQKNTGWAEINLPVMRTGQGYQRRWVPESLFLFRVRGGGQVSKYFTCPFHMLWLTNMQTCQQIVNVTQIQKKTFTKTGFFKKNNNNTNNNTSGHLVP